MAKVKFSFGSKAAFDRMAAKDPSTVYFVNETGDFSSASLDADGDIYLGEKLLTGGGDGGGAAAIPAVAGMPSDGVLQPNVLYQLGVLQRPSALTLSPDFNLGVKNEWRVVAIPAADGAGIKINPPTISGYACVVMGDTVSMRYGTAYDISVLYAGMFVTVPGLAAGAGKTMVFTVTYKTTSYVDIK